MAEDGERLVVLLEARIRDFERNMQKASAATAKNWKALEARSKQGAAQLEGTLAKAGARLGTSFAGIGTGLVAGLGLASSGRAVAAAASQYVDLQNALRVTGLEGKELDSTLSSLFQIANKQGTAIAPLVTLFGRATQAQKELGASSADILQFSEGVAVALRVAGTSATEASGALLQLGQALGSGKVQAEEFNSVNEGARPILQAVANGLKEAGGSVSKLKALVNDGKVSSQAFFKAFLAGMPSIAAQADKAQGTVSQAMNRVQNAFVAIVGHLDDTTKASSTAADNLSSVAAVLERLPGFLAAASKGFENLQGWLTRVGNSPFWTKLGTFLGGDLSPEGLRKIGITPIQNGKIDNQDRIGSAFDISASAPAGSMKRFGAQGFYGPQLPPSWKGPPVKRVSLNDFPVIGGGKGKGGGSSGGGGKTADEMRYDQVESYIESLEKSQRILEAEFGAIGKSNAERARSVELARIGEVGDKAQLDRLTGIVGKNEELRAAIEKVHKAQQAANEAADYFGNSLTDGLASAIIDGEELSSILKRLIKDLANAALQSALMGSGPLGGLFGGGGQNGSAGGLFGGLLKSIGLGFADGGRVSGPGTSRSDSIPAMLSDGEYVVNAAAVAKYGPLLDAINSGKLRAFADGGPVSIPTPRSLPSMAPSSAASANSLTVAPSITVNVAGGSQGPQADEAMGKAVAAQIEGTVRQLVITELRTQMRPGGMMGR